MRIKRSVISAVKISLLALVFASANVFAAASFLQLSGNTTQVVTADTTNQPLVGNLNSLDESFGSAFSYSLDNNTFTVNEDGAYFVMFTAQVGAEEDVPYQGADVRIWITKNGEALPDSGSWVFASEKARAKTIVSQFAIHAKKGDKFQLMYSASSVNGGLVSFPATPDSGLPNAPAITLTAFKLN